MIRISPIRLIGPENEQIGVVETSEALRMGEEQGLDLVEISPDARPPVCKLMDYGKFKYEQSKDLKSKSKNKAQEIKEVRLGRSIKIDPHDVKIRIDQSRRFLMEGHKVQVILVFRGREMMHRDLGIQRLREVVEALADISKVETPPRAMGRRTMILLAPDKPKIEAIKRKLAKEAAKAAGPAPEQADPKKNAPVDEEPPIEDEVHDDEQDTSDDDAATRSESAAE
ncbi:MAG: translation initiation factor IF-3 [Phycisphaerales bacterium]|nr:MAG: translation initiation factor IF-3 [Phycisphaerales bacterium]